MRQLKITKQVTNRDSKSLEKYLQDVSKIDMITADEEVELAQRIKDGDQRALNKLVRSNLRFVISVAKQYQNQGLKLSDLINEGNYGLVKAAKRFDETRGFKFISYAVWWIRQSILQAISEQSRIIRLPLNKLGTINKIRKASARIEQLHQREPSVEELASELDLSEKEVASSLKNSGRHTSLDAPLRDGETSTFHEVVKSESSPKPDADLMHGSLKTEINRALNTLSEKEEHVLKLYFGLDGNEPASLYEIGELFDLTRERVRQIREKALRNLRRTSKNRVLQTYLG